MTNNILTVIASGLLEMGEMYLTRSYEDKGGKGPGLRVSPVQWGCVVQKAIDQVNAVVANLPIEERATRNAERVQITLAFPCPVNPPRTTYQKVQAEGEPNGGNLSSCLPIFL